MTDSECSHLILQSQSAFYSKKIPFVESSPKQQYGRIVSLGDTVLDGVVQASSQWVNARTKPRTLVTESHDPQLPEPLALETLFPAKTSQIRLQPPKTPPRGLEPRHPLPQAKARPPSPSRQQAPPARPRLQTDKGYQHHGFSCFFFLRPITALYKLKGRR